MKVKIISPTKNAMQSGMAKEGSWLLTFPAETPPPVDALTGWSGMADTNQQLGLRFVSKEAAIEYAQKHSLQYDIVEPKQRVIKPKSYAANFAFKNENRA